MSTDTLLGSGVVSLDAGQSPLPIGPERPMVIPCRLSVLPESLRESSVRPEVPSGADILNIGASPRRDDLLVGRPFQGPTGDLSRQWLLSAGLLARSAFAYVESHRVRDYLCRNCGVSYWDLHKVDAITGRGKPLTKTQDKWLLKFPGVLTCEHVWRATRYGRDPLDADHGESCGMPVIRKLLASPRWKLVLCWGAVPGRTVAGYKGAIGSMVGRFRSLPAEYNGTTVTVLYPAYDLIRARGTSSYAETESLQREILRQVRDRVEHPESARGRYPFIVLGEGATPEIRTGSVVDIETIPAGKTPDPRVDVANMLCVGHMDTDSVLLRPLVPSSVYNVQRGARIVTHHGQYDGPLIAKAAGHLDFQMDDTMVMAYLCGEQMLGLKPLARRRLGLPAREYLEKDGPEDNEYDAQDPHLTRELKRYYDPIIHSKGLDFLYNEVKVPLQTVMVRHVMQGLRLDQPKLRALYAVMLSRSETLRQALFKIRGGEFNLGKLGTTNEVEDIVYSYGIPEAKVPGKRGETERSTNETHIGQFRRIPFISTLLAYRKAMMFVGRIEKLLGKERVSGLYDLTGTGTDRISQSNDNCMNFNRLIKECIMAELGGYFVYGDYSQIELRLAAYFSRDPYLLAVIREGRNMHEELCIAVYGARTPDTYTQAKSSNFAKLFGAGLPRRAKTLKKPVSVVQRLEIPWPGWDAWVEERRREPAKTYWGYERNLDDALDSDDERLRDKAMRQVINSIIQGTAGEINQYAQVLADRYLQQLGGYVIHQEHDSVLGWVPSSIDPEEGKAALALAMREAAPREIQEVIEIKAKVISGSHWG